MGREKDNLPPSKGLLTRLRHDSDFAGPRSDFSIRSESKS